MIAFWFVRTRRVQGTAGGVVVARLDVLARRARLQDVPGFVIALQQGCERHFR